MSRSGAREIQLAHLRRDIRREPALRDLGNDRMALRAPGESGRSEEVRASEMRMRRKRSRSASVESHRARILVDSSTRD